MSDPAVGFHLVLVSTVESMGRRLLPGETFPDWAAPVTEEGQIAATFQLINWGEGRAMVTAHVALSRDQSSSGHPPVAVSVTIGALYDVQLTGNDGSESTEETAMPPIEQWPNDLVDTVIKAGLVDTGPFLLQALHFASATVDPTNPILINVVPSGQLVRRATA